jgi:hypothetical protein
MAWCGDVRTETAGEKLVYAKVLFLRVPTPGSSKNSPNDVLVELGKFDSPDLDERV